MDSLYIDCIRNIFKSEEKSLKSYKIDDVNFVGQEISGTPYFVGIFREVLDSGNNHLSSILKTVEKMKEKNSDEQLYIGDEGIILMDKEVLQKYSC